MGGLKIKKRRFLIINIWLKPRERDEIQVVGRRGSSSLSSLGFQCYPVYREFEGNKFKR